MDILRSAARRRIWLAIGAVLLAWPVILAPMAWAAPTVPAAWTPRLDPPAPASALKPATIPGRRAAPAILARALPVGWVPRYSYVRHGSVSRARLAAQAAGGSTLAFWSRNILSRLDGQAYALSMVGSDPYAASKQNTVVSVVPIIARLHFPGGVVFDPTQPSACETGLVAVQARFLNSPLFAPAGFTSNGVDVSAGVTGGTQFGSAFQRANFWSATQGSGYGVTLSLATPVVVDINAPAGSLVQPVGAACAGGTVTTNLGEMDIGAYDAMIQTIAAAHAGPMQFAMVLTYNVVLTESGGTLCCILGYHGAQAIAGGTQTYGVGSWIDPGIFNGQIADISVWSHELGEWLDDPFVNNATPAWGHIGQVQACQNNLEVGDPLSGSTWVLRGAGGFVYHFQDLAFHDWFYRTRSTSTGGLYAFRGRLTSVQGPC